MTDSDGHGFSAHASRGARQCRDVQPPAQRAAQWAALRQMLLDDMTQVLLVDTTPSRDGPPAAGAAAADADAMAAADCTMQELLVNYEPLPSGLLCKPVRAAMVNFLTYTMCEACRRYVRLAQHRPPTHWQCVVLMNKHMLVLAG